MTELLGLPVSPFTEKARWALDHHGIRYRYRVHVPMVGELALRLRLGKVLGRATVPVLFTGDRTLTDSFIIARWAEDHGSGAPLFPADARADIGAWNDRSETALDAGRALVMRRFAASKGAAEESVPRAIPAAARGAATGISRLAFRFISKKYSAADADDQAEGRIATLSATLVALRDALAGRPHLLGGLTYADITMAAVLQCVGPVSDDFVPMGPATRDAFTLPEIATRFADLLAWRDELYAGHRPRRSKAAIIGNEAKGNAERRPLT